MKVKITPQMKEAVGKAPLKLFGLETDKFGFSDRPEEIDLSNFTLKAVAKFKDQSNRQRQPRPHRPRREEPAQALDPREQQPGYAHHCRHGEIR
jgi:hypothetical protein